MVKPHTLFVAQAADRLHAAHDVCQDWPRATVDFDCDFRTQWTNDSEKAQTAQPSSRSTDSKFWLRLPGEVRVKDTALTMVFGEKSRESPIRNHGRIYQTEVLGALEL